MPIGFSRRDRGVARTHHPDQAVNGAVSIGRLRNPTTYRAPLMRCRETAMMAHPTPMITDVPATKAVGRSGRSVKRARMARPTAPRVTRKAAAAANRARGGTATTAKMTAAPATFSQSGPTHEMSRAPPASPARNPMIAGATTAKRSWETDDPTTVA